jgi:hypothetical protein
MRVYKFLCCKFGLKSLREKRLKISTVDDLNDPYELLPFDRTDERIRRGVHNARETWAATRGVLCFSSEWKDPVIWAHYSDKHKGLCLGFDMPDKVLKPVTYTKEMLQLTKHPTEADSDAWLFTKYESWAYEKEMRSWTDLTTPSDDLYFMDFGERLKLVEVIVGARCKLTKNEILVALNPLTDVKLTKSRADFQRFEIVEDQRNF